MKTVVRIAWQGVFLAGMLLFFALAWKVTSVSRSSDFDFVFLVEKVGDPPLMVMFQLDPDGKDFKQAGWCLDDWSGGYHQWQRPWNVAVLRAAKRGDVIKRNHDDTRYFLLGREVYREHEDRYMPERIGRMRQIYRQPRWPFNVEEPRSLYRGSYDE